MLRRSTFFAIGALLVASSAFAQTPPVPPKPQAPAAPQLFSPKPATPFPEGVKVGFINFQVVALESASGKAATLQLKALQNVKFAEIEKKDKALQALQAQQAGTPATSAAAATKIQRDIELAQLEIQYAREVAQREIDDLNDRLMAEFSAKVRPIVEEVRAEKGLWAVFVIGQNFVTPMAGVDLSMEVVQRLDSKKLVGM